MATKAEKQKSEAAVAEVKPPVRKSKKKLAIMLIGLLLLGGGGLAAYTTMKSTPAEGEEIPEEATEEVIEKKPPVFVTLENFLVNLRDDDGDHYLQLGIVLEVSDQATVDEVKLQMPRVRNGILLLLSSKTSSDIATLEGKQRLSEEIMAETRKPMSQPEPNKGIESVYFSAFVIQ